MGAARVNQNSKVDVRQLNNELKTLYKSLWSREQLKNQAIILRRFITSSDLFHVVIWYIVNMKIIDDSPFRDYNFNCIIYARFHTFGYSFPTVALIRFDFAQIDKVCQSRGLTGVHSSYWLGKSIPGERKITFSSAMSMSISKREECFG